jgi:hypothetical protein
MSENVSTPSWALLPTELLEKIFEYIPAVLRGKIGLVCSHWLNVLHPLAIKHLITCVQNHQVEEKQLERWGWSSTTAWNHNTSTCSCIHLAFNYFTTTSRQEKSLSGRGISNQCTGRGGKSSYVAYMADKLFFATASEERNVSIMVFNRLEPNSLPRPLTTPVEHQSHEASVLNDANMIACEDLLAVLWCDTGNVSLWNGQSETWLSDIDMSLFIPHRYVTHEIAVSKDMLAVLLHVNDLGDGLRDKILFFRLNTSRPTADIPPQFMGTVQITKGGLTSILMNEKWFFIFTLDRQELLAIQKLDLFSEDQSRVADIAKVAETLQEESPWRYLIVNYTDAHMRYLYLQPGNSSHLAVELISTDYTGAMNHVYRFRIFNLDTGECLSQVLNVRDLLPSGWWGDAFLFLQKLPQSGRRKRGARLQAVLRIRYPNPDPPDPHVLGLPGSGSGSISLRYESGSGSGSFFHQEKKVRKILTPTSL